ncbi:MAG: DUF5123 domain-containing protein, partial [Actinomycetota bacterium]|nr:DUF5123 domain-containing protein [Actinomycetota bacterium]
MRWVRGAVALASAVAVTGSLAVGSADASSPSSCALVASPSGSDSNSGSAASPFLTSQKLVDSLQAGQTGCLMGGTYDLAGGTSGSQLKFNHGGSRGAPLTLESYPGQMATLTGGEVYVPHGSDYVNITNLSINTHGVGQVGVQIMGAYDQITDDNITNLNTPGSCIILGSDTGYGQAAYPLVADNVIHQCGYNPGDPFEDHGVYDDNTVGAVITNNVFWGMPYGWGVQLYPNSQGTQVTHNVIDNNGNGVVVGGNSASTSSNNAVADNVISNSSNEYNIQTYWGGAVGTGNVAKNNCVYHGNKGDVSASTGLTASNNLTANPGYTDAAAHNYTLPSASPCLSVVGYDPATVVAASMSSRTPTTTVPSTGKLGRAKARKARSAQARAGQAQAGQAQAGQGRGR